MTYLLLPAGKPVQLDFVGQSAENSESVELPLFASKIAAGFPSPADDYIEQTLDLNEYCVSNPPATFLLQVREDGFSMVDAGIFPGDVVVVDRSLHPQNKDIVVAVLDGEFTLKELVITPEQPVLRSHNANYADITRDDFSELEIFGVVTTVIRKFKRGKSVRPY